MTRELLQRRLRDISAAEAALANETKLINAMLGNGSTSGKRRGRPPKAAATTAMKTTKTKSVAAPDAEAGMKAVDHLKKTPGEWVSSAMLAEEIGTTQFGAAIKATGEKFESKGPDRGKMYRVKE